MTDTTPAPPRCAVLIGPYLSGKTTLLEALLFSAGAIHRKGSITEGNTVGDSSPEARAREMSVEPNFAHGEYLGESWSFIDCPGSVELSQDSRNALMAADVAVLLAGFALAGLDGVRYLDLLGGLILVVAPGTLAREIDKSRDVVTVPDRHLA